MPNVPFANLSVAIDVIHAVLAGIADGLSLHFDGARTGEKAEKIDEMANLAQNASTSLIGIVHPMIGGNITGIHPVVDGQRFVNLRQTIFHLHGHGCESTIEPDHQKRSTLFNGHIR